MKIFHLMAARPWPFLVILPSILLVIMAVGWTRDDIIEEQVYNIWTPTRSSLSVDRAYERSIAKEENIVTVFAAMAISRDGGNLFTASRLEEIRTRMEQVEQTTVEYKGNTFTWDDFCATNNVGLGTSYNFICARLSAMDFFQEAEWYFDEKARVTFYKEFIRKRLVKPLVPRFGILSQVCTSSGSLSESDACDRTMALRTNVTYAMEHGRSSSYANPILLLADIGQLEMNDVCKICIEDSYEALMVRLTTTIYGIFTAIYSELRLLLESNTVPAANIADLQGLMSRIGTILETLDRAAIEEFYTYYVVRGLYVDLGASSYANTYATFMSAIPGVQALCQLSIGDPSACPLTLTLEEAKQHLANHADNTFSSITTAGAPFPFWSEPDGSGYLFAGTFPVSGSGIDMSGTLLSSARYLDLENYGDRYLNLLNQTNASQWSPLWPGQYIDPFTQNSTWTEFVETDPVYRWFLGGVTNMTSHCGNGDLSGTSGLASSPFGDIDAQTAAVMAAQTPRWCTKYNVPVEIDETVTETHFAKMWFDLLVDSDSFLGITQGENTPYDWTTGSGCGYTLKGSRNAYTGMNESTVLQSASSILYNVDEGVVAGPLDRNFLMGGTSPSIGDVDQQNPFEEITVIQNIYPTLGRLLIPERLQNCNRPGGQVELDPEESRELLTMFKETFENAWTAGWDDPEAGEVQFVGFFDDQGGTVGTTGRVLLDLTLDNTMLTAISIIIIASISCMFLFSFDAVQSKVLVTLCGVCLVILSYFSALGLGILCGIKINISIAWTLPFIILGLGVDDMYIILLSLKRRRSYTEESFVAAMKEVIVPVSLTSLVNVCMFAVMNLVDIPAVSLTARMAVISIIFLYLTVIVCFPAYCYLDMKRQAAGRVDVLFCFKQDQAEAKEGDNDVHIWLYTRIYKKLVVDRNFFTAVVRFLIFLGAIALVGVGIFGITERRVGLGLQDLFPSFHQAHRWAVETTDNMDAWGCVVRWGENDYGDPDTQLFIMRQFEQIVETPYIAEIDTKFLWLAAFNIWMSRHCTSNFDREDPDVLECGRDQVFQDGTTCSGTWAPNKYQAKEKLFGNGDQCYEFEGGVCRPTSEMHPLDLDDLGIDSANVNLEMSWCPVFKDFSEDKLQFCLMRWANVTGSGGGFIRLDDTRTPNPQCDGEFYTDAEIEMPLRFSEGPTIFAFDLKEHEDYLAMISETRAVCDDVERVHCWLNGIPFMFWEQYLTIERTLLDAACGAVGIGFAVSFLFLFAMLKYEGEHAMKKIVIGSLLGASLIAMTSIMSLVAVVGISTLVGVNITAFSVMSYLLSVGFSIEYSVHIILRFMKAPLILDQPLERVEFAMAFLTLPTFMSFVSSTAGVICLAFTKFDFNLTFFFKPLITVMFVTYYIGCWFLPVLLSVIDVDALKCGSTAEAAKKDLKDDEEIVIAPLEAPQVSDSASDEDRNAAQEQVPPDDSSAAAS